MKWAIREGNRSGFGKWLQTKNISFEVDKSWSYYKKDALTFTKKSKALLVLADVLDDIGPARLVRLVPKPVPRGTLVLNHEVLCMVSDFRRNHPNQDNKGYWIYYLYRVDGSGFHGDRIRKDFQKYRGDGTVRRDDGRRVRLDRWESGIRSIATYLGVGNKVFEVDEIVEEVRKLIADSEKS